MHSFLVVAALLVSSGFVFSQESDDYAVLQTRADASQNVRVTQKTSSARATNLRLAKEKPPDWEMYVRIFNKSYTDDEKHQKETIYAKRVSEITQWNNEFVEGKRTHVLGVNAFTDGVPSGTSRGGGVTKASRRARALNVITLNTTTLPTRVTLNTEQLPTRVDWRDEGAVTPVKKQGQWCGSNWAFSATGALEGAHFLKTGNLVSFSAQQLMDCSNGGRQGCVYPTEWTLINAFKYVQQTPLMTEEVYPYTGSSSDDFFCKYKNGFGMSDALTVNYVKQNSDQLKAAVAMSPVPVWIQADQLTFQDYSGGVITSGCGTPMKATNDFFSSNVNHPVLAVGYDTLDGQDFFIVKNSWGPSWGASGYVNIAPNQCGILSHALLLKPSRS